MIAAALLTAAVLAQAAPASWAVDAEKSRVTFALHHNLHAVDGRAKSLEGRALVDASGRVQAMVRIPVASLDTDEANRDANLRATMEAGKFPFILFKGVGTLPPSPPRGQPVALSLAGELEVHGVKRPLTVPLQVTFADDGTARVQGAFEVSLEAHRVDRPSLLMIKVDDTCKVALDLAAREDRR